MANHVSSYISFQNLSVEAYDFLNELMPDYQTETDEILRKIFDLPEGTEYNWDGMQTISVPNGLRLKM